MSTPATLVDRPTTDGDVDRDGPEFTDHEDGGRRPTRSLVAVGLTMAATGVVLGGVFVGTAPRVHAVLAGVGGLAVAVGARRLDRTWTGLAGAAVGVFVVGLATLALTGPSNVTQTVPLVSDALEAGDLLRPPLAYDAGWAAVLGWVAAAVGFAAGWTALVAGRPVAAALAPLAVATATATSLPDSTQLATGSIALALTALALGVLAGTDLGSASIAYEARRGARSLVIVAVVVAVVVTASRADLLFPAPLVDPERQPQRPDSIPLSEVEDRVLFEVEAQLSGPWRMGSLDVYEDGEWLLAPFADQDVVEVPRSGIVQPTLEQGAAATFRIAGLSGVVLPALPNTVGVAARGPALEFDRRTGSLKLAEGQVRAGIEYAVTAASLPSLDELRALTTEPPASVREFLEVPEPPPGVRTLLDDANARFDNPWDRFDFARQRVLDLAVAAGPGRPVPVTPERVEAMLVDGAEASPYEIVAAQALLARWVGVPSRIAYGFDGGEETAGGLRVRPRHGAAFVEVWFPGHEWLPVIAAPRRARPTTGGDAPQQFDPDVAVGESAGVRLLLPVATDELRPLGREALLTLAGLGAVALVALLGWVAWSTVTKARSKTLRRRRAETVRDRVAVAYAEWRELAADLGFDGGGATPLAFLSEVEPDDEHTELAWLVTRVLWGDLAEDPDPALADHAEELARSLRRRLAQTQSLGVRVAATVSRGSHRAPYAPLDANGDRRS